MAGDIPIASGDSQTVAGKLTALETAASGKVATVNGKSPTNGAVTLGAADIKASDGETVQAKLSALEARPQGGATEYTGNLTVAGWTGSAVHSVGNGDGAGGGRSPDRGPSAKRYGGTGGGRCQRNAAGYGAGGG